MIEVYTVEEAAALLDVRPDTIRVWLSKGKLQGAPMPNVARGSLETMRASRAAAAVAVSVEGTATT